MCAPAVATAKPVGTFRFLVADPGDQTRPSIDGQFVVYQGPGPATASDVWIYSDLTREKQPIAAGPGDALGPEPELSLGTVIYRAPGGASAGISIEFWANDQHLRDPPRPPASDGAVSSPTIGTAVAAWETERDGARAIRVSRWAEGREWTLPAPRGGATDPRAPAAFDDLVGFVDGADGDAAWLYDSAGGTFTRICDGPVASVSVGANGGAVFVAVARRSAASDWDVEVWRGDGSGRERVLTVPGVQRNPHLSGAWLAFEDVSTEYSQVVLWNWTSPASSPLVFVPHPSATQQALNDLSAADAQEVRAVFEDSFSAQTGKDIALYVLDVSPLVDDGTPDGYPIARCDGTAPPLATLHLGREKGAPLARELAFDAPPPDGATRMPVLVCIDADRVSSAWVTLDGQAIASPSDFEPHRVHLEAHGDVLGGSGRLAGVIAGKPGASLVVRVYADPARLAVAGDAVASGSGSGAGGCGTGRGGIAAVMAVALLLARRRPDRR